MRNKKVKGIIYLTCLCMLSGCGTAAGENGTALNEVADNYEAERMMTEEELAAVEWKETLAPYMEYDWLEEEHIERYLDTAWTMQLADLNLDGQEEMLITLPIYNGESQTYIYTVEAGAVVYCGQVAAGAAYEDNEAFMSAEGYLPSGYMDGYQNKSGEFRYLSGNTFLKGNHGYYQVYESEFVENHISCKPLYWIDFSQDTQGQMIYQYAEGDWMEQEGVLTDDQDFTGFAQAMDTYMEGWEKVNITFLTSEFRVPGFVDELTEEKKEIIRDNIPAGFAIVLSDSQPGQNSEDQPETDDWEGKYGYYDLEGKAEQEFVDSFLGTGSYEKEPYFSYINPEEKLQLVLWHNTDSDLWCGIRYAVTDSEKTDGYPYGFVMNGEENQEEVAEWNLEPLAEVLGADEFLDMNADSERMSNIKENIERDEADRLLSYRVSGDIQIHDHEKKDAVREGEYLYSINYTYYDNGMTEKTYDHNTSYFGTLGHFRCMVYDDNDRAVYSRFFWTSYFSGEGYYIYDPESELPVCELLIDQGTQGVSPWMRFFSPE